MFSHLRSTLLAIVVSSSLAGCGPGGPELVDVSGTVTLDGKPIPGAIVTFNPDFPGGSNSMGKTDSSGKYRLEFSQDRRGALVGKHIVEITTKKISANEMPDGGEAASTQFVAIPAKYRKRGALTAEVSNQARVIDFALESK